jgi:hypothetical protein
MTGDPPPILEHQDRAIDALIERDNLLVEYGTGTGKTRIYVEFIEALVLAREVPILVLVPNELIEQTTEEFSYWLGSDWTERHLFVLDGTYPIVDRRQHLKYGKASVFLLSHESMSFPMVKEGMHSRKWMAVILDEASRFRNWSNRTRTLTGLRKRALSRYAFTGNLAPRVPSDVWYVMSWLDHDLFETTNRETFTREYCLLGGWEGRQPIGLRPDKRKKFRAVMDAHRISCDLSDVRDLPERVLHVYRVNADRKVRTYYRKMQTTLRLEIERMSEPDFRTLARTYATRLQRLQEICSGFARNTDGDVVYLPSAKTTAMLDIFEDDPTVPTIVWYSWTPEQATIHAALKKNRIPFVDIKEKDAVRRFMDGEVDVFVAQVAQGGYGLNLTRARRMIYHSLPWSLEVYLQSQERNMRLTTTADRLEVIHLVTRESVEEYVRKKLLERADVSATITRSQALDLLRT